MGRSGVGSRLSANLLGDVRGSGDGRAAGCLWLCDGKVRIYDPVAGGAALVVIDVDSHVEALAVFKDPATGEPRLACGRDKEGAHLRPGRGWRGAACDRGGLGEGLCAGVFADPATGALRLACGCQEKVRIFDPVAGGEALVVLEIGDEVNALAAFKDPATGAPRLACASGEKVLVFDPVAGGDALLVLDIGSYVNALAVFKEPATSAPRLACALLRLRLRLRDSERCASSTRFLAATRCSCSTLGLR